MTDLELLAAEWEKTRKDDSRVRRVAMIGTGFSLGMALFMVFDFVMLALTKSAPTQLLIASVAAVTNFAAAFVTSMAWSKRRAKMVKDSVMMHGMIAQSEMSQRTLVMMKKHESQMSIDIEVEGKPM